jgi:tRNA threonylcarbamoyladenosine biosynthesis protein TsaB
MSKSLQRLVIDTATKAIYLGLFQGEQLISYRYQPGQNDHSVTLMPLLSELLLECEITLHEIDEVFIGIGPGSYTGVRIGVSVGKMIGYLNAIPAYSFSSLLLLATSVADEHVVALVDARRGNAFMGYYQQHHGIFTEIIADALEPIEAWKEKLPADTRFVTEGIPDGAKLLASGLFHRAQNIHDLAPNYLQITEAERNREIKQ